MTSFVSYYSSPLGLLQITCSEADLNALTFVEQKVLEENENDLTKTTASQLEEYFCGKRKSFDLPFAQNGTEFQQKVWQLLCEIPYGKTISYRELSRQYGDLKAIRAVASANGKNNLAILVPCHRVIGSNNTLTGYAGGLWRKQWLLEHEAKHHSGVVQQSIF